MERINHVAVITAAVAFFLLGWIWYTVFKSAWMFFNNITVSMASPTILIGMFVIGLVMAYIVAIALSKSPDNTATDGMSFGLFMGVGLVATAMLMDFISEARPLGLWAIDAGYIVVGLAVMGAIVAGWKRPGPA
ncbi:MAG: hypothetical protein NVS9B12_14980 [Vulcanimicrobiaceae bacterium]